MANRLFKPREGSADGARDVLDLLLAARDPDVGAALTQGEIRDEVGTVMAAGFETTARAMFWTMYLLSNDRTAQDAIAASGTCLRRSCRPASPAARTNRATTGAPLGAGPRICLGAAFATAEAMTILAIMLARYEVSLDDSSPVFPTVAAISATPSIEPMFRLTPRNRAA